VGVIYESRLELIRRVKAYELLAARAIIKQDRALAIDALMLHPLVNSWSIAKHLADQYIEYNTAYLGGRG
jgi:6-phospho-beta-glucosidase